MLVAIGPDRSSTTFYLSAASCRESVVFFKGGRSVRVLMIRVGLSMMDLRHVDVRDTDALASEFDLSVARAGVADRLRLPDLLAGSDTRCVLVGSCELSLCCPPVAADDESDMSRETVRKSAPDDHDTA